MYSYCVALLVNPQKEFLAIQLPGNDYWQLPAYKDTVIGKPYEIEELNKMLEELLGDITHILNREFSKEIEWNGDSEPATTVFHYNLTKLGVQIIDLILQDKKRSGSLLQFAFLDTKKAGYKPWWNKQQFLWKNEKNYPSSKSSINKIKAEDFIEETYTIPELKELLTTGKTWDFAKNIRLWSEQSSTFFLAKETARTAFILQFRFKFLEEQKNAGIIPQNDFNIEKNQIFNAALKLFTDIKESNIEAIRFRKTYSKHISKKNPSFSDLKYLISINKIVSALDMYKKLTRDEYSEDIIRVEKEIHEVNNEIRTTTNYWKDIINKNNRCISQFIDLIDKHLDDDKKMNPNI